MDLVSFLLSKMNAPDHASSVGVSGQDHANGAGPKQMPNVKLTGPSYAPNGPAWLPFGPRCVLVRMGVARPMLPPEAHKAVESREARQVRLAEARLQRLRHLKPIVLDTTLLEIQGTDVGDPTTDPADAASRRAGVFRAIKLTGVSKYVVSVECGGRSILPDDLARRGLICGDCAAMVELYDGVGADGLPVEAVPAGLARLRGYDVQTVLLECDMGAKDLDWGRLGADGYARLVEKRCRWVQSELAWATRDMSAPATAVAAAAVASVAAAITKAAAAAGGGSGALAGGKGGMARTSESSGSESSGSESSGSEGGDSSGWESSGTEGSAAAVEDGGTSNLAAGMDALEAEPWEMVTACPLPSCYGGSLHKASTVAPPPATVWLHLAGFVKAMRDPEGKQRLLEVVRHVAALPEGLRPAGLLFQDVSGDVLHFEMAPWAAAVRRTMRAAGWLRGHLLVHVAHGYGMAEAITIECLASGCDGVWAGVCDEGPGTGQVSSLVTLINLARLGNPHVPRMYDLPRMRELAIEATRVATGAPPHPRTEVYGSRALDVCFDGMGDDGTSMVAAMLGTTSVVRVSTMATPEMLVKRLSQSFGDNGRQGYDTRQAVAMLEVLHHDLLMGEREDYDSSMGLASLWERSGNKLPPAMLQVLNDASESEAHPLVLELKALWDNWAVQEAEMGHSDIPPGCLSYTSFYHGFMGKYFSCFACDTTSEAYSLFVLDKSESVSWRSFLLRIKWGLAQYGADVASVEQLLQVVFEKLIIPEIVVRLKKRHRVSASNGAADDSAVGRDGLEPALPLAMEGITPAVSSKLSKANMLNRDELYDEWKRPDVARKQVGVNVPVTDIF